MAEVDQLGLFGLNQVEDKRVSHGCRSLSLTIDFVNLKGPRVDDAIKRVSKSIEDLDPMARVLVAHHDEKPWFTRGFLAIDVETTGLDAASHRIIELAIVPFNMSDDIKPFCQLFSVGENLSPEIVKITGITDAMLLGQPSFNEWADVCLNLLKHASFLVAYNAKFDRPFLESELARFGKVLPDLPWVDPFVFVCELDRFKRGKKLQDAARRWGVNLENAHRARADAEAAGKLLLKMAEKVDCHSLDELLAKQKLWQWHNAHNLAELKRANSWSTNR
ncbi:MAG TPA: 3'-5' exonuclease [Myxococcota bacterium]|nr:3'-5' exonuclease [Myxococcota bacterium]